MTIVDGRSVFGRHSGRAPFQNTVGGFYGSFANFKPGGTLPSYYSVTRATVSYDWDGTQFVQTPSGQPSFWYGKGLASFVAGTNLALWSSDFSNAAWSTTGSSKGAASTVISGGTAQVLSTSAPFGGVFQTIGTFTGSSETMYAIVEAGTGAYVSVQAYDATGGSAVGTARYTFATDAVTLASGTGTAAGFKLKDVGPNGGKLVLLALTFTGTAANARRLLIYTQNTSDTFYAHHAQLVTGTRVLPPIVTNAATATRNADVISIAQTNLPWLSANPAQLYLGANVELLQGVDATQRALMLSDGTTNNRAMASAVATNTLAVSSVSAGVAQSSITTAIATGAGIYKIGASFVLDNVLAAFNGVAATPDTSASMPTGITTMSIGCNQAGAEQLNGFIGSIYAGPTTQAQAWLNGRTSSSSY